jgi:MFS family permease
MAKQPPSPSNAETSSYSARESDSTAGLLSRLLGDVSTLLRKEIALAKAEVSQAASEAKAGAISVAAGGALLFAAALILFAAIILLLAEVMEPWLAAFIVCAVVGIVGFILMQSGKKKLSASSFKPERAQEALRKDKDMVQRRAT